MGSQSSKLVNESQQKKEHLVQLSQQSSGQANNSINIAKKEQQNMVNTLFKWNFGGNSVQVTGTFSNWQNHIQLQKQGQEFSICVRLPPGIHQYKFIVDNDWRFSPDDSQTTDENGNINNIIDTTNYKNTETLYLQESHGRPVPPIEHRERERKNTSYEDFDLDRLQIGSATPNNNNNNHHNHNQQYNKNVPAYNGPMTQKNTIELQGEKYGFSNTSSRPVVLPEFSFKDKAPLCPPHLKDVYFLRQKEKKQLNIWKPRQNVDDMTPEEIENQKRIEKNEILIHFFDSDHSLAPPQHVTTKHVGIKTKKNQTYNVYCITQRFKQKYTTFKFYTNQYVEGSDKLFIS